MQRLADSLQSDQYGARTLIREVVMGNPFRNSQGGAVTMETTAPAPRKPVGPMVVK